MDTMEGTSTGIPLPLFPPLHTPETAVQNIIPIRGEPLYHGDHHPAGLYLSAKQNSYHAICARCGDDKSASHYEVTRCKCPPTRFIRAGIPITMEDNYFPITNDWENSQLVYLQSFEPMILTPNDVRDCVTLTLSTLEVVPTIRSQITTKVQGLMENSLAGEFWRRNLNAYELTTLAATTAKAIQEALCTLNNRPEFYKAPKSIIDGLTLFLETAESIQTTQEALLIESYRRNIDVGDKISSFIENLIQLEDYLRTFEAFSVKMEFELPTVWKQHPLVTKPWTNEHIASLDVLELQAERRRIHAAALAKAETPWQILPEITPELTNLLQQMFRATARNIRLTFEYRSFEKAEEFWETKKGKEIQEMNVPQILRPFSPLTQTTEENQTQTSGTGTPRSTNEEKEVRQRKGETARKKLVYKGPGSSMARSFQFLALITLMTLARTSEGANYTQKSEKSSHESNNQYVIQSFVRNGFVFTNRGRRLLNPQIYEAAKELDISTFMNIPMHLRQIMKKYETTCIRATRRFTDEIPHEFEDLTSIDTAVNGARHCKILDRQMVAIRTQADHDELFNYMKMSNIRTVMAPITNNAAGVPVFTDFIEDARHIFFETINGTDWEQMVNQRNIIYIYVAGDRNITIEAYKCTGVYKGHKTIVYDYINNHPECTARHNLICSRKIALTSHKTASKNRLMEKCAERSRKMGKEVSDIEKLVHSVDPTSFSERVAPRTTRKEDYKTGVRARREENELTKQIHRGLIRIKKSVIALGVGLCTIITSAIGISSDAAMAVFMENAMGQIGDNKAITDDNAEAIAQVQTEMKMMEQQILHSIDELTYKNTLNQLSGLFFDLKNAAIGGLQHLNMLVLASRSGQTLPAALSPKELKQLSTAIYEKTGKTLTTNLRHVTFELLRTTTKYYMKYNIPEIDEKALHNIFEITAIPEFSEEGYQILPLDYDRHVAIQVSGSRFTPLSEMEANLCIQENAICHSAAASFPSATAPCGIGSYYKAKSKCIAGPTTSTEPFFYTTGNFTCFSVPKPTYLELFCEDEKRDYNAGPRARLPITQAHCFSFNPQCFILTADQIKIEPSKNHLAPVNLMAPGDNNTRPHGRSDPSRHPRYLAPGQKGRKRISDAPGAAGAHPERKDGKRNHNDKETEQPETRNGDQFPLRSRHHHTYRGSSLQTTQTSVSKTESLERRLHGFPGTL